MQRASRPGYVAAWTAVADERMEDVDGKESHASSSAEPSAEPPAEAATAPAPVLKTWSSIKELHSRLRQLGAHSSYKKVKKVKRVRRAHRVLKKR